MSTHQPVVLRHGFGAVMLSTFETRCEEQIELEWWQRRVGYERALSPGWEKGASSFLSTRYATAFLRAAEEAFKKSKKGPGRMSHIWDVIGTEDNLKKVGLEALVFVIGCHYLTESDSTKRNTLAHQIGMRSEYVLWLNHPIWGAKKHLKGLRMATGNDLGMSDVIKRLKDKGLRKMSAYQPLTRIERITLGTMMIELIAESTGLIEIVEVKQRKRTFMAVRNTGRYWDFLKNWRAAAREMRVAAMPMIVPPRDWDGYSTGGYLSIIGSVLKGEDAEYQRMFKTADPCVIKALNRLQQEPMTVNRWQQQLLTWAWDQGHEIGKVPPRERMEKPKDDPTDPARGDSTQYWQSIYRWKRDQKKDGERTKMVNALVALDRLKDHEHLHYVHYMDHRGRMYPKGGQIGYTGSDPYRSLLDFTEKSPINRYEGLFAWSVGDALGLPKDARQRIGWCTEHSEMMRRIGLSPQEMTTFWIGVKKPWRFVKLCHDWAEYLKDSSYTTGTPFQLDQTTSGYGHVACLTRDGNLAKMSCVTGDREWDLYIMAAQAAYGFMAQDYEQLAGVQDEASEKRMRCIDWWMEREFDRDMFKKAVMPYIYGRGHSSLVEAITNTLISDCVNFLTEDNLRLFDVGHCLAHYLHKAAKGLAPGIGELSRWLKVLGRAQVAAGHQPHWITPNGLMVESWTQETSEHHISLDLSGRKIRVRAAVRDQDGRKAVRRGIAADFIHSFEAAFLQRFVSDWAGYRHPIATIHDCFSTTLNHVEQLELDLRDSFARFYYEDHLQRIHRDGEELLGVELPAPPNMGSLDVREIGGNSWLFC